MSTEQEIICECGHPQYKHYNMGGCSLRHNPTHLCQCRLTRNEVLLTHQLKLATERAERAEQLLSNYVNPSTTFLPITEVQKKLKPVVDFLKFARDESDDTRECKPATHLIVLLKSINFIPKD